mmetsp:Transcript_116185/g.339834  ORF Transcript_116185/g.339834 Transcript_116185/m.339834 type:complete len:237 (-) Transcript_116185:555-1265(-)
MMKLSDAAAERAFQRGSPSLVAGGNLCGLLDAVPPVEVLQQVEERLLLALEAHWGVLAPLLQHAHGHARGEHGLAEVVALDGHADPVRALRKRFEWAGGRVAAVVAGVGRTRQAKLLPVLVDRVAQRPWSGSLRISAAKHLPSEVCPAQLLRVPLNLVVVDAGAWGRERRAHAHVEAVDDVDVIHLAAVEATTKLEQVHVLLACPPLRLELCGGDPELGSSVHGVVDQTLTHSITP